jgi:hypothetical protein
MCLFFRVCVRHHLQICGLDWDVCLWALANIQPNKANVLLHCSSGDLYLQITTQSWIFCPGGLSKHLTTMFMFFASFSAQRRSKTSLHACYAWQRRLRNSQPSSTSSNKVSSNIMTSVAYSQPWNCQKGWSILGWTRCHSKMLNERWEVLSLIVPQNSTSKTISLIANALLRLPRDSSNLSPVHENNRLMSYVPQRTLCDRLRQVASHGFLIYYDFHHHLHTSPNMQIFF